MSGSVLLARTAAADMYPPERRARAISYVLFGALFGAALGPLVFRPLFAGKDLELDTLVVPWFAAAAMAIVGVVIALLIRPDPRTIALELQAAGRAGEEPVESAPPAPLREILRRPGVPSAAIAALSSFAVMVGVMNLTGYIVVGHQHEQADVFTVISLHIVGMYALVLVIGAAHRPGRPPAVTDHRARDHGRLHLDARVGRVDPWTSVSLFLLGLGWNVSYVAATAELVTHATPVERGRLIGATDLAAGLLGASLALLGGAAYSEWGGGRGRGGRDDRGRRARARDLRRAAPGAGARAAMREGASRRPSPL